MVGWHHRLNGHEFEPTLGNSEGQGSLLCYSSWVCRVRHDLVTEQKQHKICYYFLCFQNFSFVFFCVCLFWQFDYVSVWLQVCAVDYMSIGMRFVFKDCCAQAAGWCRGKEGEEKALVVKEKRKQAALLMVH